MEQNGFEIITGRVNMQIKSNWMLGAKDISVKLVVDTATHRILGGHAIGEEGPAWRMNVVVLAIKQRMTISEFTTIELAHRPAVLDVYDHLLVAADNALRSYEYKN